MDQGTSVRDEPAELGFVASLAVQRPVLGRFILEYIARIVKPALQHRQFKLYFNSLGEPAAFAAWAFLAPDAERRCLEGYPVLEPSEWRAGSALWIVDLAAPCGNVREILADLGGTVFAGCERVRYCRSRRGTTTCTELWRDSRGRVRARRLADH